MLELNHASIRYSPPINTLDSCSMFVYRGFGTRPSLSIHEFAFIGGSLKRRGGDAAPLRPIAIAL
jgi:hypothetical protein